MTGGISIEPLYNGLHDCNGSDPCRAREDCNRPGDDGEESMTDHLLRDLKKLNAELRILSEYQVLIERRISQVFRRLEKRIEREAIASQK